MVRSPAAGANDHASTHCFASCASTGCVDDSSAAILTVPSRLTFKVSLVCPEIPACRARGGYDGATKCEIGETCEYAGTIKAHDSTTFRIRNITPSVLRRHNRLASPSVERRNWTSAIHFSGNAVLLALSESTPLNGASYDIISFSGEARPSPVRWWEQLTGSQALPVNCRHSRMVSKQ